MRQRPSVRMGVVDSEKRGQWLNHLEFNGGYRGVCRFWGGRHERRLLLNGKTLCNPACCDGN